MVQVNSTILMNGEYAESIKHLLINKVSELKISAFFLTWTIQCPLQSFALAVGGKKLKRSLFATASMVG